jgi:glutathione S-transferase
VTLKLVIGNKNYSSWSLRAWLFLKESGIDFEEIRIPLFTDQWREQIGLYSPARRVPVLVDGDLAVWDTQAIYSYVRELYPTAIGWPKDREARAVARSIAAEMHAGFMGVRNDLPQNIRARRTLPLESLPSATLQEIERILFIWGDCKKRYGGGGPWLFGEFTIADVVYAPVALRFLTYDIPITPAAKFFMDEVGARRKNLLKKIKICKHYSRLSEREMPGRQIRSIIARRYDIKWNRMGAACEPCKKWIALKK